MPGRRSTTRVIQLIALAGLWACAGGCTGWSQLPASPPIPIPEGRHYLRVTLQNGTRLQLGLASVIGDSLISLEGQRHAYRRTALALNSIRKVEVGRFSPGKTAAAIALQDIGTLLLAGILLGSASFPLDREKHLGTTMVANESRGRVPEVL